MHYCRRVVAALVGVFACASLAVAGEYQLLVMDGNLVKWGKPVLGAGASVTYAFATKPRTFPGARNCADMAPFQRLSAASSSSPDQLRNEARSAFDEWEQISALTFTEVEHVEDADIVIGTQGRPVGWAFSNVAPLKQTAAKPVIAQKAFGYGGDQPESTDQAANVDGIRQSLICLNASKPWKIGFDGNLAVYDIRYTLAHEIGHAIGLDHPGAGGALMGFRYDEKISGPQASDAAAARRLYGPPVKP